MLVADEKKGTKKTEKQLQFDKPDLYHCSTSWAPRYDQRAKSSKPPSLCVFLT